MNRDLSAWKHNDARLRWEHESGKFWIKDEFLYHFLQRHPGWGTPFALSYIASHGLILENLN